MFDTPHRLHPAAIAINVGAYFIATIRGLFAPVAAILFSGRHSSTEYMTLMIGGVVALIGGISIIGPVFNFFSTTFYIQNEALEISSGFIWRKRRTIPLARIQNVNIERTLWHRILGAAAVKVETAAGGKPEGDLTALSLQDANKLQTVLLRHREIVATDIEETKPAPLYELSTKKVLLAGALGNRALYIVASMLAVFQFEGSQKIFSPLLKHVNRLSPAVAAVTGALLFVGLVVVGWLMSIVISATRFYGFRIERHERGLLLTHGLVTQVRSIIPVGRIQDVRVQEPILFRLFGYCEVYADTAGSYDAKDPASANKICPILPMDDIDEIGKLLLPEFQCRDLLWQQVSRKAIFRHAFRSFIAWCIFLIPLAVWIKFYVLTLLLPLAFGCGVTSVLWYRYTGFSLSNDLLGSRHGVFRRKSTLIPFDRIQNYTVSASVSQRWRGLASLTAVSASTGGHPIVIMDVDREVADQLAKAIGEAIQKHVGSRRSGL